MKTAEGMVEFSAPQMRDTPEPFVSAIRENLAGRTQVARDLAVELYARGLSTRDIEDAFRDECRRLLSRATMSEITERLWAEYEAFARLALTYKSDRLRPEDLLAALAYSGKGTIKIGKLLRQLGCAVLVGSVAIRGASAALSRHCSPRSWQRYKKELKGCRYTKPAPSARAENRSIRPLAVRAVAHEIFSRRREQIAQRAGPVQNAHQVHDRILDTYRVSCY
jgi:Transposase, Mutator family